MAATPIKPTGWATNTNYASGPQAGNPTKVYPTAQCIANGLQTGQALPGAETNYALAASDELLRKFELFGLINFPFSKATGALNSVVDVPYGKLYTEGPLASSNLRWTADGDFQSTSSMSVRQGALAGQAGMLLTDCPGAIVPTVGERQCVFMSCTGGSVIFGNHTETLWPLSLPTGNWDYGDKFTAEPSLVSFGFGEVWDEVNARAVWDKVNQRIIWIKKYVVSAPIPNGSALVWSAPVLPGTIYLDSASQYASAAGTTIAIPYVANGPLVKSTDGGLTWSVGANLATSLSLTACDSLWYNEFDSAWYIIGRTATGCNMYKSVNGGTSFSLVRALNTVLNINVFAGNPAIQGHLALFACPEHTPPGNTYPTPDTLAVLDLIDGTWRTIYKRNILSIITDGIRLYCSTGATTWEISVPISQSRKFAGL